MVLVRSLCDAFLVGRFITSEMIGNMSNVISTVSKFLMVMALGAIGLLTDFKKVMKSGFKPMLHGFIISALVVVVAYVVQVMIGQV